jgi:hypothetical protein
MRVIAYKAGDRGWRLLVVVILGLALGACSKCDVPFWRHNAPPAPGSCHDGPEVR